MINPYHTIQLTRSYSQLNIDLILNFQDTQNNRYDKKKISNPKVNFQFYHENVIVSSLNVKYSCRPKLFTSRIILKKSCTTLEYWKKRSVI